MRQDRVRMRIMGCNNVESIRKHTWLYKWWFSSRGMLSIVKLAEIEKLRENNISFWWGSPEISRKWQIEWRKSEILTFYHIKKK